MSDNKNDKAAEQPQHEASEQADVVSSDDKSSTGGDHPVAESQPVADTDPVAADQPAETVAPKNSSGRGNKVLWALALINLAALGASAFWLWQSQQQQGQQLIQARESLAVQESRLQDTRQALEQALKQASQQNAGEQQQAQALQQLGKQLQHNTELLAKLPGAERQDWLLAEAEYLLRLANQRLTLERDWQGAVAMLEAADAVLLETSNPRWSSIRARIASELLDLRKVPAVDTTGAVYRLQALQDAVEALDWMPRPVFDDATVAATADQPGQAWYQQLWQSVRSGMQDVVRIRRHDEPLQAPISPSQTWHLQQNMRLMLEQAQIAVLRQQQPLYERSLDRVIHWMDQYLMMESADASAVRESLLQLRSWNISPAMPDISASLKLLSEQIEADRRGLPLTNSAPASTPKSSAASAQGKAATTPATNNAEPQPAVTGGEAVQ